MLVTLFGILTLASDVHDWNACEPIVVTLLGMLIDVNSDGENA
jgi:hypothetical protein